MCGLLGFSGHKGQKFDKDKIKTLFLYNQERGKDASGFWSPKNELVKSLDQASKFLIKDFKKIQEDCMLIGHVRQGTIGKNMLSVAHPFVGEKAVLAHNGTLSNYSGLAAKYELAFNSYTTDTEALHKIMDTNFSTKILTEIDGSASLLIADKNIKLKKGQENSFLMAFRLNNQRPLFYGMSNEGMYISSLEESLEAIECTDITEFDTNKLYTIFEGKIIKELTIPARPYTRPITTNSYTHYGSSNSNVHTSGAVIDYWFKYVNNWIKCDTTFTCVINGVNKSTVKDQYYLLKSIDRTKSSLNIQDADGNNIDDISYTKFYYNQPIKPLNALQDSFVVIMKKLTDTNDKTKVVFHKGDVVKILARETIDQKGNKTITCVSNLDGEDYSVNATFVRPCETSELSYHNVYDPKINKMYEDKVKNVHSKEVNLPVTQESFIAQHMIESGLLTSDEIELFLQACDNKEMSALFDIAEESIIEINDFVDIMQDETDSISIVAQKVIKNTMDELKDKISSLLINAVNSWKTQSLV